MNLKSCLLHLPLHFTRTGPQQQINGFGRWYNSVSKEKNYEYNTGRMKNEGRIITAECVSRPWSFLSFSCHFDYLFENIQVFKRRPPARKVMFFQKYNFEKSRPKPSIKRTERTIKWKRRHLYTTIGMYGNIYR
jgi:hypothetical protein